MRLLRYGPAGEERPAAMLADGSVVDVADLTHDYDQRFFAAGGLEELRRRLADRDRPRVDLQTQRVGPPIAKPYQELSIGLNYADHAAESGMAIPTEPIVFNKSPRTIVGPDDDVVIPRGSRRTDWEVELAIVIGSEARYLEDTEAAARCIAGYAISNDVSERDWQLERGGQWVKGKSADTFNPLGPWLVTPDEIADVNDLELRLDINGEPMQSGSTATMVFDPFEIVRYLSQFLTLEPGDVINTGTPPGVGLGQSPPRYLEPGDEMVLSITGLGEQRQTVKAFAD
jgi:2-keto-4-pentenoate hydratase/2-oxohepta-3-ene-1,7-dioic acid hydratase in catechol pathway